MSESSDKAQEELDKANKASSAEMAKLREDEKKKRDEEYKQNDLAKSLQATARFKDELGKRNKTGRKNPDGTEETLSDELAEACKRSLGEGGESYNDWRACMMSLLNLSGKLSNTMAVTRQQKILTASFSLSSGLHVGGDAYDTAKGKLADLSEYVTGNRDLGGSGLRSAKSWFVNKIKELSGDPSFDITTLQHKVGMKDGKLDLKPLTRADGVPLEESSQLNVAFKSYVTLWLAENNYILDPSNPPKPGVYVNQTTGVALDDAAFKKLNESPKTSFSTFLKENADLEYEEQAQKGLSI